MYGNIGHLLLEARLVWIYGMRSIRTLANSALVNSDLIFSALVNSDPDDWSIRTLTTGQFLNG